ncbi:MAG: DMT family transporter [Chloroflexi bacterium]|nr:DMT family transporter [Chloroflexota bacterium]
MKRDRVLGYLFAVGAIVTFAGGQVLARYVVREVTTPLVSTAFSLLFGMAFLFLFALPQLGREGETTNSRRGLLFFAAAGLGAGVAMMALFYAMSYSPVAVVSSIGAIMPLFALLLTHFFLQHLERVTWRMWLGGVMVVCGVILVTLSQVAQ